MPHSSSAYSRTKGVAARDPRIGELERLLAGSRRADKRQAAQFSKGKTKVQPKRKPGEGHGRHGSSSTPLGRPGAKRPGRSDAGTAHPESQTRDPGSGVGHPFV